MRKKITALAVAGVASCRICRRLLRQADGVGISGFIDASRGSSRFDQDAAESDMREDR